jgi:hypothetical protein
MRAVAQKRFGLGIIVRAAIAALALFILGVPLVGYDSRSLSAGESGGVTAAHIEARLPLMLLAALVVTGAVLVVWARRRKQGS